MPPTSGPGGTQLAEALGSEAFGGGPEKGRERSVLALSNHAPHPQGTVRGQQGDSVGGGGGGWRGVPREQDSCLEHKVE